MTFTAVAALGVASIIFLLFVLALRQRANTTVSYSAVPPAPRITQPIRIAQPIKDGTEQAALRVARAMAERQAWALAMDLARQEARRQAEDQVTREAQGRR